MNLQSKYKAQLIEVLKEYGLSSLDVVIEEEKGKFHSPNAKVSWLSSRRKHFLGKFSIKLRSRPDFYLTATSHIKPIYEPDEGYNYRELHYVIKFKPYYNLEFLETREIALYDDRGLENFFSNIISHVRDWLRVIGDENKFRNKIDAFFNISSSWGDDQYSTNNDYFDSIEQEKIKGGILELKSRVKEDLNITQDQFEFIVQKLDDVIEKVDKFNKFDFKSILFGVIINIGSSILYDSAGAFYSLFMQIFNRKLIG
jgi:hypothetical protein